MCRLRYLFFFVVGYGVPVASIAAQGAPAGASGQCQDSTYSFSATKRGACSKHGGVREWYSDKAVAPAPAPNKTATHVKTPSAVAQRGDSTGTKVWVNTASNVYHCPGSRWYGATKKGSYMTEAAAKVAGARPAYGKPCS